MIADRGYYKGTQILDVEKAGVQTYIPKPMASTSKAEGRFSKADFVYVLELERCLLTDDLALVPWLAMNSVGAGFHDGPQSTWQHGAAATAPAPAVAPDVHH